MTRSRSIPRHRIPAPTPTTFNCDCGTVHHSADACVPKGWSTAQGLAWCADCTTDGVPARELAKPATKRRAA